MVAAANPYAVEAGLRVLAAGGHAVDAAIAAHAVLGLVEPQSSGLGGGAFLLAYERASGAVTALDGRETAPRSATAALFLGEDGAPLPFLTAWQSGRSVGVPGMPALYLEAHDALGRLPLADVLGPAIRLAKDGFTVSPRLADFLANERLRAFSRIDDNPATAAYFYPGGEPLAAGDVRPNPQYAATLEALAEKGRVAFYEGPLAEEIVAAVAAEPLPGTMTLEDLAAYRVVRRESLCAPHAELRLCAMPPPSSGLTQLMIFGLYDRLIDSEAADPTDARWRAFVDAQRLAYADRDRYVGDPDFVAVPARDLITAAYLDARAAQRAAPQAAAEAGDPGQVLRGEALLSRFGPDSTRPLASTSHLSVVDGEGNAVAMTASVEAVFGSSRWAGGFLLNNQLTDFARDPDDPAAPAANRVEAGKRPRSSMSPTMVFETDAAGGPDRLRLLTGSPGGNSIVAYTAKSLLGVLRWGLSAQEAVDLPNVVARGETVRVETGVAGGEALAARLAALGYPVQEREGENSGLHVIAVTDTGLDGAADPRREGQALALETVIDNGTDGSASY